MHLFALCCSHLHISISISTGKTNMFVFLVLMRKWEQHKIKKWVLSSFYAYVYTAGVLTYLCYAYACVYAYCASKNQPFNVSIFLLLVGRDSNLLPSKPRTQLVNLNFPLYILCRRLSTIIVAVTLDPKPDKLKENVTINFKHLKVTSVIKTLWSFCAHLVQKVIKFKNLFSPGYRRYETLCVLEWRQRKKVKIKW